MPATLSAVDVSQIPQCEHIWEYARRAVDDMSFYGKMSKEKRDDYLLRVCEALEVWAIKAHQALTCPCPEECLIELNEGRLNSAQLAQDWILSLA